MPSPRDAPGKESMGLVSSGGRMRQLVRKISKHAADIKAAFGPKCAETAPLAAAGSEAAGPCPEN